MDMIHNRALEQQIRGWKKLHGFDALEDSNAQKSSRNEEEEDDVSGSLMFSTDGELMVKIAQERYAQRQEEECRLHGRQGKKSRRQQQRGVASTTSGSRSRGRNIFKKWARALTSASR
jgi:hypothetical protein